MQLQNLKSAKICSYPVQTRQHFCNDDLGLNCQFQLHGIYLDCFLILLYSTNNNSNNYYEIYITM